MNSGIFGFMADWRGSILTSTKSRLYKRSLIACVGYISSAYFEKGYKVHTVLFTIVVIFQEESIL